jgi:outer membrane protein assembly factor BamB
MRYAKALSLLLVLSALPACASGSSNSSVTTVQKLTAHRSLVLIDAKTGKLDRDFPNIENAFSVVAGHAGGWYVGGDFARVGKTARNGIVHLRSDGSLDPAFVPKLPKGDSVSSIVLHGDVIYANDSNREGERVVALDARSGRLLWRVSFEDPTDVFVSDLAYGNGTVYVVGNFGSIGGVTRNRIAALDARSGKPTRWRVASIHEVPGTAYGLSIGSVAAAGGSVFIGGENFDRVDGVERDCSLFAVSARTGRPTAWAPSCNPRGLYDLGAILVTHGEVIAGGSEGTFPVLDLQTGSQIPWEKQVFEVATVFAVAGDTVYLGNDGDGSAEHPFFSRAGGKRVNNLAAVTLPEGKFTDWRPDLGLCSYPDSIAANDREVLVAGRFSPKADCS